MNPFNNSQLIIEDLPIAEELQFVALEPSYRKVQIIGNSIFWLLLVAALTSAALAVHEDIPSILFYIIPIFLFILIVFSFLSIVQGFKNKSFAVRQKDIHYKTGWLWKSKTVVPFKRIQHSEVSQGPIDRIFDLGKLRVFTAGGSGSDLTIPGLKYKDADQLKTLITSKITAKKSVQLPDYEQE